MLTGTLTGTIFDNLLIINIFIIFILFIQWKIYFQSLTRCLKTVARQL